MISSYILYGSTRARNSRLFREFPILWYGHLDTVTRRFSTFTYASVILSELLPTRLVLAIRVPGTICSGIEVTANRKMARTLTSGRTILML